MAAPASPLPSLKGVGSQNPNCSSISPSVLLSPSPLCLWRPAAQRNVRNQWLKLFSSKTQWAKTMSEGRSYATSLVNACLNQRSSVNLGAVTDMPKIREKTFQKLAPKQETYGNYLLSSYKNMVCLAKLKPISTPTIFNPLQGRSCQKTTFLEKKLVSSLEAKTFTWNVRRRKIVLAADNSQSSVDPSISESGTAQTEGNQVTSSPSIVPQNVNFREPYSANSRDPVPRRPSLTMREKLRAARFLSKYMDSKPVKEEFGSRVLEASRASDSGKRRPGLPEAPTSLFDDSKRGLPQQGWTFELPFQGDIFFIIFSFVFISTVMLATTFIVWKSGAIHFNEY